jgi:two-component system LytT family response regulator
MNVVIVEDEQQSANLLKSSLIELYPDVQVLGIATDKKEAMVELQKGGIDIAFLDINLGGSNTLDILKSIDNYQFEVIFTTAHKDFALQALKLSAVDYLIKPYTRDALREAVSKAMNEVKKDATLNALLENLNGIDRLVVHETDGVSFIELDSIEFLEADGGYTYIRKDANSSVMSSKNLAHFHKMLKHSHFYRVHHSYIVNLRKISKFNTKKNEILLHSGAVVPVSVRKKKEFFNRVTMGDVM